MNCIEQLLARRSIRKYKNQKVSEEVINNILEAGRQAPSAANFQTWHFIVIKEQKGKEACTFRGYNLFTKTADFIIIGLYRKSEVMMENLALMDITIALQNMVIAAWLQGVGSCWIGAFDEIKLKETLNLPADSKIVGLVPFGIPDEKPSQRKKPLSEIVHFDKW